jgi:TolB-like protein/Tfp pilus assembly protein PilF
VPLALDTLVQQCLAKDAKDRPESAGALMLALEGMITASGDTAAAASAATVIVSRMRRSRRKWYVGGGLVLAASVALTLWWMSGAGPRAGGGERASVAVLPFTDLSADGKSSYFGDGLSETLVSTLTAMPSVDVVAPSSSFALRNTPDVREIGRELDVDAVVEGSVQRNGDRVRITAQVVRTQDGRLLWSQNFDRAAADVFVVQDEVADAVARALGIAVPGAGGARSSGGTRSAEAYDLYLQGRALVARRGTADVARAITLLRQALALDSAFAAGWAGLGDAYIAQALYSDVPTVETLRLARASVERALTIAPQLGEALATRAYLRFLQDWDVASADAQFRQAITAAPSHAMAYKWHADVLVAANRPAEALAALETARRLDPRSAIVLANLAGYYRWRGDSAAQAQWTERALAIDPYLPLILRRTTIDAFDRGDSAAFFEAMTRLESVSSRTGAPVPELRDAWRSGGKREVARAQVAAFEARGLPFERARWRMRTGDLAGAFRDLEVAFMERAVWAPFAAGYFADKDMRADPRFTALLNKYGLPLNASQ